MLNQIFFAATPVMLALCVTSVASANESFLEKFAAQNATAETPFGTELADDEMGAADVEALLSDGTESSDESIAACYSSYRTYQAHGYTSYYTPTYYSYNYRTAYHYRPVHYYAPVSYSYSAPVYRSYWGCW